MNLDYLRTYVEVVKSGSLSAAARKLFLSQPAVTLQIQKLEKEMGFRLIDRDPHHFSLTRNGKSFYRFAEYVCQEHNHLLFNIAKNDKGSTGRLSIMSTPIIGEFIVPSLISKFKESNPAIDINVKIASSLMVNKIVLESTDTVGFSGILDESAELKYIKIGEDQMELIVYPGHPFAIQKNVTVSDLGGESLILRAEPENGKLFYISLLKKVGIDLDKYQPKIIMGTATGVLSAVEAKAGIGFVSNLAIKNSEALGLIKVIKLKNINLKNSLYCVHRKDLSPDSLSASFVNSIKHS
jgi:LysR family transcriptional regulator, transcriptional activator of the cysJI operon